MFRTIFGMEFRDNPNKSAVCFLLQTAWLAILLEVHALLHQLPIILSNWTFKRSISGTLQVFYIIMLRQALIDRLHVLTFTIYCIGRRRSRTTRSPTLCCRPSPRRPPPTPWRPASWLRTTCWATSPSRRRSSRTTSPAWPMARWPRPKRFISKANRTHAHIHPEKETKVVVFSILLYILLFFLMIGPVSFACTICILFASQNACKCSTCYNQFCNFTC